MRVGLMKGPSLMKQIDGYKGQAGGGGWKG